MSVLHLTGCTKADETEKLNKSMGDAFDDGGRLIHQSITSLGDGYIFYSFYLENEGNFREIEKDVK